MMYYGAMIRKL